MPAVADRCWGTLVGVALLSLVGPALTFLGTEAAWERALQGLIILAAVSADVMAPSPIALDGGRWRMPAERCLRR